MKMALTNINWLFTGLMVLLAVYPAESNKMANIKKNLQKVFYSDFDADAVKTTTPPTLRGSTLVSWSKTAKSDECTLDDERPGRCVHSYLCINQGGKINDDGTDLTDERTIQCLAPMVCCPVSETIKATTTKPKHSTLVPGVQTTPSGPGQTCEAFDGSSGRCLYPHLCSNDTTISDGSDLLDERTVDPCPNWQDAIQICCPESFWKGKIDVTTAMPPTPDPKDNDVADKACTTASKQAGFCVPFYQCDDDFDGADVINVRFEPATMPCGFTKMCCPKGSVDKSKTAPTPAPPVEQKCGVANPKGLVYSSIRGNVNEAKYGEFPWMVAVRTRTVSNTFNVSGGSIIHPWVVLTAAHYVVRAHEGDVRVRAGEWDLLSNDEPLPHQERVARRVLAHPDFNNRNKHNDIAILFLSTPFQLAPHVGVICLPPSEARAQPSTDCVANGWGKTKFGKEGKLPHILKKTTLPVMARDECQQRLRNTRLGPFYILNSGFMCAGGERLDTCTQDGGGPLACPTLEDENRYILNGIVSWGIGCGQDGVPGVYMDVAQYRSWILKEMKSEGYQLANYSL